jgi:seryl-tRNA(Sec) selenium transferase
MSYDLLRAVDAAAENLRVIARALERREPPATQDELERTAQRLRKIATTLAEQAERERNYTR